MDVVWTTPPLRAKWLHVSLSFVSASSFSKEEAETNEDFIFIFFKEDKQNDGRQYSDSRGNFPMLPSVTSNLYFILNRNIDLISCRIVSHVDSGLVLLFLEEDFPISSYLNYFSFFTRRGRRRRNRTRGGKGSEISLAIKN